MNDWYPSQDAKLFAFPTNSVLNAEGATTDLGLLANTFAGAAEAAQNWLRSYTNHQVAQKSLNTALATFQKRASATEENLRATAKQIKGIMNVPNGVLALRELTSTGDAALTRVAAQALPWWPPWN